MIRRLSETTRINNIQLQEHEDLVNAMQPQFQTAQFERNQAVRNLAEAEARATSLNNKLNQRVEEINTLKETIARLKAELQEARNGLRASAIPSIREMEELRSQARAAEEERAKAEKRVASTTKDFEFTKEQYQAASNQAAALGRELEQVKREKAELERKASSQVQRERVQSSQAELENAELIRRIKSQEIAIEDLREQLVKAKEDVRKAQAQAGRTLRGNSTPGGGVVGGGEMQTD